MEQTRSQWLYVWRRCVPSHSGAITWHKLLHEYRLERMELQHITAGDPKVVVSGRLTSVDRHPGLVEFIIDEAVERRYEGGSSEPSSEQMVGRRSYAVGLTTRVPRARPGRAVGIALDFGAQLYLRPLED